ncbi:hypothetical protein SIID45300_01887 [Candidatus Magnetaquicoccaceae bacterium FCR-1]|uniref:Restriction endonuclease type IV Mrr domain-containing protein n=1 Tax=Candidatus Magnetaquiglobus chichijimensis TaxID=3141448 RepID=A0ABQ0C9I7_9PROT
MVYTTTESRLNRLKEILQKEVTPGDFENLTAALLSKLLGVSIAIAKSGFQHGGDAGPSGRQERRFRIETKRYEDKNHLSGRELLGEVDHAKFRDPAIEAWFLAATRNVPEQLEQDLQRKSDELGLPIVVIDWKPAGFPALAALCTSSPNVLRTMVSEEAEKLASDLVPDGSAALVSLKRDLESWNLGFEKLRTQSLERLTTIWNNPRTSMAVFGQNASGGNHHGTIRRQRSFKDLSAWWADRSAIDAPAVVTGWEGVGKTWAVLDWLNDRQGELPIVLVVPASAVAGMINSSHVIIKEFIGKHLYELTEVRDPKHWQMRFDRLLKRPLDEGPILTLLFDGMNQEPSVPWSRLISIFQDEPFSGHVRLILTTRKLYFIEKLSSLHGLVESSIEIPVDIYDDAPGGELDQRLQVEGLTRNDLHDDLIALARTPRLFNLVVRFRDRFVDAGQVTVHRLLWEYGRDSFGIRANGNSFSEEEWHGWLLQVAKRHKNSMRRYDSRELIATVNRGDLTPDDISRRLSEIIDAKQFTNPTSKGQFELTSTLVAHALACALLVDLIDQNLTDYEAVDRCLSAWFDPIGGLDEKAEILRAAVSIQIEQESTAPVILSGLVCEWLRSQNIPDGHRSELTRIAIPLCDALLDVIERIDAGTHELARFMAVNALRAVPRTNTTILAKIVDRATDWLRVVSRDVDPRDANSDQARAQRFLMRIGFDEDRKSIVLGQPLVFVENRRNTATTTIPSLLEGFPLVPAQAVFEAAALHKAIRRLEEFWDGLEWLCLLNDVDFDATAEMLRARADEVVALIPEIGVHVELSHRVAALMLWLSGNEANETAAEDINPSLDQQFSYERDYLSNPAQSWFTLERRHAEQVLNDKSLTIHRRINRTEHFFFDPTFIPPSDFCTELREAATAFDVSSLDTCLSNTHEDHAFETLVPVLARCAPDLLASLIRKKLIGFSMRSAGQRQASARCATTHLLLANDECAKAACTLRTNFRETDENNEAYVANHFLMLEIQALEALDQIQKIVNAELKYIFNDIAYLLKPLSPEDTSRLVHCYVNRDKKQISGLVCLLSESAHELDEDTWQWLATLAMDKELSARNVIFKMLNTADSHRFGRLLMDTGWKWEPHEDVLCNHYGSLALIAYTSSLPFEQNISLIAPWLLLKAIVQRGESAGDAQLAADIFSAILFSPKTEAPDLGSDISIKIEKRKADPSCYTITVRPDYDVDLYTKLRTALDPEKQLEIRKRAFDTAVSRIKSAQASGASLYLRNLDASDFKPIIEHVPSTIEQWMEGAATVTFDFRRRASFSEGFYLALCEALLSFSPEQGAILWHALRKTLATRYLGIAKIDEMIHMLFRSPNVPEPLRNELLSLTQINSDQGLFELAIVASIHGEQDWLNRIITDDLNSEVVWRTQRAGKLTGFSPGNTLPVPGAWPDGQAVDLHTSRQRKIATWKHNEYCSRHWWNVYWQAGSDEEAYAAWVLFLETADRRAYQWMFSEEESFYSANPSFQRRMNHFNLNKSKLESKIHKQEEGLDSHFLDRKIVNGIGPWGKVID